VLDATPMGADHMLGNWKEHRAARLSSLERLQPANPPFALRMCAAHAALLPWLCLPSCGATCFSLLT
jgi:hypothetical protein